MPIQAQLRSLQEVGSLDCEPSIFPCTDPLFPDRLWHENPEWISDLSESLAFRELFRFQFQVPGHINVNESRTYKSWIKSMAKFAAQHSFLWFVGQSGDDGCCV